MRHRRWKGFKTWPPDIPHWSCHDVLYDFIQLIYDGHSLMFDNHLIFRNFQDCQNDKSKDYKEWNNSLINYILKYHRSPESWRTMQSRLLFNDPFQFIAHYITYIIYIIHTVCRSYLISNVRNVSVWNIHKYCDIVFQLDHESTIVPLELEGAQLPLSKVAVEHLLTPRGRSVINVYICHVMLTPCSSVPVVPSSLRVWWVSLVWVALTTL